MSLRTAEYSTNGEALNAAKHTAKRFAVSPAEHGTEHSAELPAKQAAELTALGISLCAANFAPHLAAFGGAVNAAKRTAEFPTKHEAK